MKNATTNSKNDLAACFDALYSLVPLNRFIFLSWSLIRTHVNVYNTVFMENTTNNGTVVKNRLATVPFTPSK